MPRHLRRKWSAWAGWLTGSRHLGWKLLAASASLLVLVAALLPVPHRVSAPAMVEGETQRAAVAPFAGYIRTAPVRAGDTVKAGQLLARLDDKDLQLERVRWESELEVSLRKEREALHKERISERVACRDGYASTKRTLLGDSVPEVPDNPEKPAPHYEPRRNLLSEMTKVEQHKSWEKH